jgi:hypothetical protein
MSYKYKCHLNVSDQIPETQIINIIKHEEQSWSLISIFQFNILYN